MINSDETFMPGDRVLGFDNRLYVNDRVTPLSVTMKPATIICRYGYVSYDMMRILGWSYETAQYPDLCDIKFDHRPDEISKAHFTVFLKRLEK
jgi:hypothetical protein